MDDRASACMVALRRMLRATEESTRATAQQSGLSVTQLIVLQIISERGEATPKWLAAAVGVAPATATALIEKLVVRGLVARRRGDGDRRQVWLSLTEAGRALLAGAPDPLRRQLSERMGDLADWEQAMLVAALERLAELIVSPGVAPGMAPAMTAGMAAGGGIDAGEADAEAGGVEGSLGSAAGSRGLRP